MPMTSNAPAPAILGYMARDQYGTTLHFPNATHIRKTLLEKLGRKSCQKMYMDHKNGEPRHIGYVVGKQWFTVYSVCSWHSPVRPS